MDIENSKKDVSELFQDLAPMVTEVVDKYAANLDKIIGKINNATALTNEDLRQLMLELSVETYLFGMSKDASVLRQECATTLMKEAQAKAYNATEGTQQIRTNQSLIATTDRQVVNMLYSAVGNLMKTKIDEAHRLCNTLNSILISRNAEAKLAYVDSISATTAQTADTPKQILNEDVIRETTPFSE